MKTPRTWVARIANMRMPGCWNPSRSPNPGRLTLSCELSDAGVTHTGRMVDVVIDADQLERVQSMIANAIGERDAARIRNQSMKGVV